MKEGRFMFMRSPQQALDVIAELIRYQAPLKDQDAWLRACVELGLVAEGEIKRSAYEYYDMGDEEE